MSANVWDPNQIFKSMFYDTSGCQTHILMGNKGKILLPTYVLCLSTVISGGNQFLLFALKGCDRR